MTTEKLKNKVIFDSNEYLFDNDGDYIHEDLDYLLSETVVKPKGEIVGWVFLSKRISHYGSIANNGATGYRKIAGKNLIQAILSIQSDSFTIEDSEGVLEVNYYDHDGSHSCTIKPIAKSREDDIESKLDDFDDLIEYVNTMPSLKIKK